MEATLHRQWERRTLPGLLPFDGTSPRGVFGTITSHGPPAVVVMSPRTGSVRTVTRLPSSQAQAAGSYSAAAAVWKVYLTPYNLDIYRVQLWTPRLGLRTVGGSHSSGGQTFPSPWVAPVLAEGHAAWVEGLDPRGRGRIMLLDTSTGRVRIAHTGHPGPVLIYRHLLIWGESLRPGALTRMFAEHLGTLRPAPVPAALARLRGPASIATDQTAFAWVGPDQRTLFFAANATAGPVQVARLHDGGFNPPLELSSPVVMVGYSEGLLAATAQGSWATVAHGGGGVAGHGRAFLVTAPTTKSAHVSGFTTAYVPAKLIRLAQCR